MHGKSGIESRVFSYFNRRRRLVLITVEKGGQRSSPKMFPFTFHAFSAVVARDFANASFAFETIRGIDVRSKYRISLKNLIHLNGVRPLPMDKKKSVDDGVKMDPITPTIMKVS